MKHILNMNTYKGGYVINHLNEFNMVTSQLSSVGVNFDDEVADLLFLCLFLESWNGLVMAIHDFISSFSTLNVDDVVGSMLSEEMQRKTSHETSGNSLTAESRGRKMEGGRSLGNHIKSRKGIPKSRSTIVFQKCQNKLHLKKDCKYQKGKEGDRQQDNDHEENVVGNAFRYALILSLGNITDS